MVIFGCRLVVDDDEIFLPSLLPVQISVGRYGNNDVFIGGFGGQDANQTSYQVRYISLSYEMQVEMPMVKLVQLSIYQLRSLG
jgi:hypothetical protein